MTKYFCILTDIGAAKLANATALGQDFEFSKMALGDGGGSLPTPAQAQTSLVREVRREALNSVEIDENNPNWIVCEQVLPASVGGWTIREMAIYDTDGDMVAVGNFPETYKPILEEGSGRTQTIRMVIQVSNAATVTLKIDPAVVLATREYVDKKDKAHSDTGDPHPQYRDASYLSRGLVPIERLPGAIDSIDLIGSIDRFDIPASRYRVISDNNTGSWPDGVNGGTLDIYRYNSQSTVQMLTTADPVPRVFLRNVSMGSETRPFQRLYHSADIGSAPQIVNLTSDLTALTDYVGSKTIATGSAVFDNTDNSISLEGIGVGVEIGDVVTIVGSSYNSKEFTAEVVVNDDKVIVNQAHANGTTSKALVNETAVVTVNLLCKWYLAQPGLGQDWVNVGAYRFVNNTPYSPPYPRGIIVSVHSIANFNFGAQAILKLTASSQRVSYGGVNSTSGNTSVASVESLVVGVYSCLQQGSSTDYTWMELR